MVIIKSCTRVDNRTPVLDIASERSIQTIVPDVADELNEKPEYRLHQIRVGTCQREFALLLLARFSQGQLPDLLLGELSKAT